MRRWDDCLSDVEPPCAFNKVNSDLASFWKCQLWERRVSFMPNDLASIVTRGHDYIDPDPAQRKRSGVTALRSPNNSSIVGKNVPRHADAVEVLSEGTSSSQTLGKCLEPVARVLSLEALQIPTPILAEPPLMGFDH